MREKLFSPWENKMKAQAHEESKSWKVLKPFPNQSSDEGRESEKESNIQQFHNPPFSLAKWPKGVHAAG